MCPSCQWVQISRERWAVDEHGQRSIEWWERCTECTTIRVGIRPDLRTGPVQVGTLA